MTTVGLPGASTYTTVELVSCLVATSACAYGSKGSGSIIGVRPLRSPSAARQVEARSGPRDNTRPGGPALSGRHGPAHHGVDQLFAVAGAEMGRAILLLYRSARQPAMAEAGRDLAKAAARPGFSLLATEDHYVGSEEIRRRAAERAQPAPGCWRAWATGRWCRSRGSAQPF
jgi:hypothetical protein